SPLACFFSFQAEDGIRVPLVTGVQTCALPIYRDMAARVSGISFSLKSRFKLGQGERVALAMKNCPEYYEVLFGCWHAGLTAVPKIGRASCRDRGETSVVGEGVRRDTLDGDGAE